MTSSTIKQPAPIACPHCSREIDAVPEFDWLWRFVELHDRGRPASMGPTEGRLHAIHAALELAEGLARDIPGGEALAGAAQLLRIYVNDWRRGPLNQPPK